MIMYVFQMLLNTFVKISHLEMSNMEILSAFPSDFLSIRILQILW